MGIKQQGSILWPDQLIQEICKYWYEEPVTLSRLYGDTDQNIKIGFSGGRYCVLKISASGAAATSSAIHLQIAALNHIKGRSVEISCPAPLPASKGQFVQKVFDQQGGAHYAWMLSWLPGRVLDEVENYDDNLLHSIGRSMALIDEALLDFDHADAKRLVSWDLANILDLRRWLDHVQGQENRQLAEAAFDMLEHDLMPDLQGRPLSIIHNDGGNQHNMLLPSDVSDNSRITGVIDFGDTVYTHRICELGIATAYATFCSKDRIHAICLTAAGYHEVLPLDEADRKLLPLLVLARFLASVCHAAERASREPDNSYAQVSADPAWQGLRFMISANMQQISERLDEQLRHA